MPVAPILSALRAGTTDAHHGLETRVDLERRVADPSGRRALVAGFYRLHAAIEAGVAPFLGSVEGLDFDRRRRTPALKADLAALGLAAPSEIAPVAVRDLSEAFGLFYVAEGSALGGRVIERALRKQGLGLEGLSFLDFYGPDVGRWWAEFVAILDREHRAGRVRTDETVTAAIRGFDLARSVLVEQAAE